MLSGYKTYLVAGAAVLGAVAAYATGAETLQQAAQLIVTAVLGMTIRAGVTTEASK